MTSSQKLSLIMLIFKKGDKTNLANYRPISLTNTDYKIIAIVLANRLQKVIDRLISKHQSAYIKWRYIGINAQTIHDILIIAKVKIIMKFLFFLFKKKKNLILLNCILFLKISKDLTLVITFSAGYSSYITNRNLD